jgi:hypothetical protein
LPTAEANQFIRQWSVELKARSFAVDLPSWRTIPIAGCR